MRKPLIDAEGNIVNIIEIEPDADYSPPGGLEMLDEHPDAVIGGTYDRATGTFTPPPEPEPVEPTDTEQRLALLDELLEAGVVDQAIQDGTISPELAAAVAGWQTPGPGQAIGGRT